MIKASDGKIGVRGLLAIVTLIIGMKNADMTTSILIRHGQTASWLMPIISALIIILPLFFLFLLLKKYQDKGLVQIIYKITGKYIGFILNIGLFVITMSGIFLSARNITGGIMNGLFYARTPTTLLLVFGAAGVFLIANRGLETIARTAWLILIPIILVYISIFLFARGDITPGFIYPIQGPGIYKLLKESASHSPILGEVILVAVLFPYARNFKDYRFSILIGLLISVIMISSLIWLAITIFDYPSISHIAFPFHTLTLFIRAGRFLKNLEIYFLFFWIIGNYVRYAFYVYLAAAIFGYTLRVKEFEPLILPVASLAMLLALIPENSVKAILYLRDNVVLQGSWIFFVIFPAALWLVDRIRGGDVNEKD